MANSSQAKFSYMKPPFEVSPPREWLRLEKPNPEGWVLMGQIGYEINGKPKQAAAYFMDNLSLAKIEKVKEKFIKLEAEHGIKVGL